MKRSLTRPRWSTLLEAAALALGCVLLSYFSCREEDPEAGRKGGEARVFSAPRSSSGAAADSLEAEQGRRSIERLLSAVLEGLATGAVAEEKRVDIQRDLMEVLERMARGRPETRRNAAGMIVQQIFDRAKLQNVSPRLSEGQRQAIQAMGRELTRQLLLLAVGSSPGADAMTTALPPGYAKLNWKELGSFAYVEGAELPAGVRELHGKQVGVPGFILTLGETENMREFVLLESLWGCCFGSVPDVNQTILVRLASDRSMDYTAAPVLVTGRMEVGEEKQEGLVASLYRVVDATVQPLEPSAVR